MNKLLQELKPNHIFICGDTDPNFTHKKCFSIFQKAILPETINKIWIYKGGWDGWSHETHITNICSIPLTPEVMERKILSIKMHISQMENPVQPGNDSRSFLERAMHRSTNELQEFVETFKMINKNEIIS